MNSFFQIAQKQTKKVIGLMSGTSVDGVDAALVEIQNNGLDTRVELIAFHTHSFGSEVRGRIFDLFQPETSSVDEICQMNFLIGEVFADAALSVISAAGIRDGRNRPDRFAWTDGLSPSTTGGGRVPPVHTTTRRTGGHRLSHWRADNCEFPGCRSRSRRARGTISAVC